MADEYVEVGYVIKTHGVKGHLRISFIDNIKELSVSEALFFLVKGNKIPYFIKEIEYFANGDAIILFEELNSKEAAGLFTKKPIWGTADLISGDAEEEIQTYDGYDVEDEITGPLGKVNATYLTGPYDMVSIMHGGKERLIPLSPGILMRMDEDKKILFVKLPEGLLDI